MDSNQSAPTCQPIARPDLHTTGHVMAVYTSLLRLDKESTSPPRVGKSKIPVDYSDLPLSAIRVNCADRSKKKERKKRLTTDTADVHKQNVQQNNRSK